MLLNALEYLHDFPPQTNVGIHKEGKTPISKYKSDSEGKRIIAINTTLGVASKCLLQGNT